MALAGTAPWWHGERPRLSATPLLARLSPANGWCHDLVGDDRGELYALVETGLIVPAELPGEYSAVWRRHGRCEEVLAELFELP